MARRLLEFDVLRRKAEARVVTGWSHPHGHVSSVRMQIAAASRNEKSLLLASAQGSSGFLSAAKQMRRLFEPCGGVARQDVLAATDFDMDS